MQVVKNSSFKNKQVKLMGLLRTAYYIQRRNIRPPLAYDVYS